MKDEGLGRRDFLKGAVVGGAAAATVRLPPNAEAQQGASPAAAPDAASPGYSFLNLEEAAFVEALVDHMVPADELSPKGTDIGINVYIDRALAGGARARIAAARAVHLGRRGRAAARRRERSCEQDEARGSHDSRVHQDRSRAQVVVVRGLRSRRAT